MAAMVVRMAIRARVSWWVMLHRKRNRRIAHNAHAFLSTETRRTNNERVLLVHARTPVRGHSRLFRSLHPNLLRLTSHLSFAHLHFRHHEKCQLLYPLASHLFQFLDRLIASTR